MKIRYCGNCNPDVHPARVRAALDHIFEGQGADTVVAVNGCSRSCVTKGKIRDIPRGAVMVNARDVVSDEARKTADGGKSRNLTGAAGAGGEDSYGGAHESH